MNGSNNKRKAVFLDRDGTINSDQFGYISDPKQLILYDFAAEAIKILNNLNYIVIIATNQSGVARGYYTEAQLEEVHRKMEADLVAAGAFVDAVYYSPYHIEGTVEPFNINHENRKPDIGMFREACRDFNIDPAKSFMIGDKSSDIEFGKNAKLTSILVRTGYGEKELMEKRDMWNAEPDYIADNLLGAAKLITFLEERS